MAYLKEKLDLLAKALKAWEKVLKEPYSEIVRDAAVQRYEFTFELLWKNVKIFLKNSEGVECNSPKSCFRAVKPILNLSEQEVELCLKMTNDRNLSVHTYSEKLAKALYQRTKAYYEISDKIFKAIKDSID